MQNCCFLPRLLPRRQYSVSCVALWSGGCPLQKITSSEEHNGRAARQECDVTCWTQLCGWVHVNRCTSDCTDKRGKSSNTSLKVEHCLWGTTVARPEQSYLAEPGPSEDFLHHWHCDKGTHLIPVIVSDAVGNATDRMDFQHLTSATMPLRLVEKKKTNAQEDARCDTITRKWLQAASWKKKTPCQMFSSL